MLDYFNKTQIIYGIMLFTLCVIGFWYYKFLYWLLSLLWNLF
jgi:hypothetical protein